MTELKEYIDNQTEVIPNVSSPEKLRDKMTEVLNNDSCFYGGTLKYFKWLKGEPLEGSKAENKLLSQLFKEWFNESKK